MRRCRRSRRRAFSVVAFESCRGDYIATLRKVADDPDPELRQRVLGILAAREGRLCAEEAARRAEESRQSAGSAREGAAAPQLRRARGSLCGRARDRQQAAERRRQARGPAAARGRRQRRADVREGLRDKKELREIRQISASALHALKPEKLQEHAREILLDKSDYDDIKATSLTALTQFGDDEALGKDKALLKSVERLQWRQGAGEDTSRAPGGSSASTAGKAAIDAGRHNGERAVRAAVCGAGRRARRRSGSARAADGPVARRSSALRPARRGDDRPDARLGPARPRARRGVGRRADLRARRTRHRRRSPIWSRRPHAHCGLTRAPPRRSRRS